MSATNLDFLGLAGCGGEDKEEGEPVVLCPGVVESSGSTVPRTRLFQKALVVSLVLVVVFVLVSVVDDDEDDIDLKGRPTPAETVPCRRERS